MFALSEVVDFGRSRRHWLAGQRLIACSVLATLLLCRPVRAIDLVGIVQSAALDQPQINLMLSTAPGSPLYTERTNFDDIFGQGITTVNVVAYFDTGASGILLGDTTSTSMHNSGQTGIIRSQFNGQPVKFSDVGVAGSDSFDVSQPLYIGLAPYNPTVNVDTPSSYVQSATPVRAQIGPIRQITNPSNDPLDQLIAQLTNQEFNVVGTPAMAGKTVVIDSRHTNSAATILGGDPALLDALVSNNDLEGLTNFFNSLELRTYVYNPGTPFQQATVDTNPGIPSVTHQVKLSFGSFDQYTQVTPAGAPGPTLAHNPFIGPNPVLNAPGDTTPPVQISLGDKTTQGSFLLDTGAAASMISTHLASQLNVRYVPGTEHTDNPALEIFNPTTGQGVMQLPDQFKLTIGGIGGQTTVAGFYLDSLMLHVMAQNGGILPDNDPNNLKFIGAPVLVHDITLAGATPDKNITLDGILGMNFLTASVNVTVNGSDVAAAGYTPGAFDWVTFDDTNGILGLALNSQFNPPIPGDFNADGKVDALDLSLWQSHFPVPSGGTLATGDADGDGDIDGADFIAWQTHYGAGAAANAVPEPAAWILTLSAFVGLGVRNARRFRTMVG